MLCGFIVLLLTGKVNFGNIDNKEASIPIIENQNPKEDITGWTDSLLLAHLLEAKVTRMRSKDLEDAEDINNKSVSIESAELKTLLTAIGNKGLTKNYSLGMGGPQKDVFTVSYEKGFEKYELTIVNGRFTTDN